MKFFDHPLYREVSRFQAWLAYEVDAHNITRDQEATILEAAGRVFANSGLPKGPDVSPVTLAVFRHELHAMKSLTVQFCPKLEPTVRFFDHIDNRRVCDFCDWMTGLYLSGFLTAVERNRSIREGAAVFEREGGCSDHPDVDIPRALRFRLLAMHGKLVELRPDLAGDVQKWSAGKSR